MGVAPGQRTPVAGVVTVGDVHAAYVAHPVVYYHHLAVVAPVQTVGQLREVDAEEGMRVHSRLLHLAPERIAGRERADMVVHHLDLYPCHRPLLEYLRYLMADMVVHKNVILHEYRLAGIAQVVFQRLELGGAGSEYLGAVVDAVHGGGYVPRQFHQRLLARIQPLRVQVYRSCGHGRGHAPLVVARHHAASSQRPSEEYVEHQSDYRQEYQRYHPRQRTDGIAVLPENNNDGRCYRNHVQHHQHRIQPPGKSHV